MPTLSEVLRDSTRLAPAEVEWLHLLVGDWQLISDLSFADLVLWIRDLDTDTDTATNTGSGPVTGSGTNTNTNTNIGTGLSAGAGAAAKGTDKHEITTNTGQFGSAEREGGARAPAEREGGARAPAEREGGARAPADRVPDAADVVARPEPRWRAAAHVRPTTGQMVFFDDIVGRPATAARARMLDDAFTSGRIARQRDPGWRDDLPIREEAVPVVRAGRALAVLTRHTNLATMRTPSRLELTYQALADSLTRMIAAGEFPHASAPTGQRRGAPRVGDGVIRLNVDGVVTYASPNALSAIHRLGHVGDVLDELLAQVIAELLRDSSPVDESLALVVTGRAPWRTEVTTGAASVSMRAIPLTEAGQRVGALLLIRDVSELRRREQELLTKDATIREIHHRVKNNLQTVAALLRLQARRLPDSEGRWALEEAQRRVATIAVVHETLSQGFDETVAFDDIAARSLAAVIEIARAEQPITSHVKGAFGRVRAEDATAMAMIISELVQNAVEHGLADRGGSVMVEAGRADAGDGGDEILRVAVVDNGTGIPDHFRPGTSGLGTQIVQSLVQDLRGSIEWSTAVPHGTRVEFTARLRPLPRGSGS